MCIAGCLRSWWLVPGGVLRFGRTSSRFGRGLWMVFVWHSSDLNLDILDSAGAWFWMQSFWTLNVDPFSVDCALRRIWTFLRLIRLVKVVLRWHHLDPNFRHFVCSGFGCRSCGPRHWLPFHESEFLSYMVDYALNSDLFICCWSLEIWVT